jgi:polar amino acid transport system substrate-binding protein
MDGITATRKIRHLDMPVNQIPILAMTAHALAYEREKCIEAGMNEHIPKPIDPNMLFAALVEWIKPKADAPAERPVRQAKNTEAAGLPDQLSGFDLDAGLSRVAGNRALFRDLLLKFAEKQPRIMEDLQSAISGQDLIKAAEIAHKIKGMSGNMGAMAVYKTAHELESILKSNQINEIDDALNRFSDEYIIARDSIASMKEFSAYIADKKSTPVFSVKDVSDALKKIGDLIHSDYGAALKALEALRGMVGSTDLEEDVTLLAKAIEDFDEDNTKTVLERLARKVKETL